MNKGTFGVESSGMFELELEISLLKILFYKFKSTLESKSYIPEGVASFDMGVG